MNTENLLMEVVRMLREREDYFDAEHKNAMNRGEFQSASLMLGESLAYSNAGEMLMAALTNNVEILREYDYFGKEVNPTE
jgi:hypothetical protein